MDRVRGTEKLVRPVRGPEIPEQRLADKCQSETMRPERVVSTNLGLRRHPARLQDIGFLLEVPADPCQSVRQTRSGLKNLRLDLVLHPDFVGGNVVVYLLKHLCRKIVSVINATVILHELGL